MALRCNSFALVTIAISAVVTARPRLGYGVQMMASQDSQGEGKKLLRLHARTLTSLTYTLSCSFKGK